ncbi:MULTISPECIES: cysteine-rich CWC family protein [Alteromonadaceae]|uniref:cysteine-rich CWC family protein n=1 Tax=Alteromonadaceae TaxID=72275 RepID=UPI001C095FE3|nr:MULTISPECIES: cysteine-rich CWC family protein [Aliiglaciecola]MBU2877378.1 cysteine-rich CWC family protein [Aliiglaciecola lipolytica]MDO6712800.1 cysteine-rich CWC family protein [Aliiglaciecola sp. 2_MG-2023]MDO6753895.1 cysteine-rich CWC family protein [Aliiglaciecola sp. 1_MG-2023]
MTKDQYVSPENCPLCNKPNYCANLSNSNKPCWCMEEDIRFPEKLFTQLVDAAINKACICKACALKHKDEH